jgi:hypothetical protein
VHNEGGDVTATANYLNISPHLVSVALNYYVDYKDEVDQWIERNVNMAEQAEASWRGLQDALSS